MGFLSTRQRIQRKNKSNVERFNNSSTMTCWAGTKFIESSFNRLSISGCSGLCTTFLWRLRFLLELKVLVQLGHKRSLWAILLLSGSSFNSEAPKNWEPLSLTWIYPVRTGASELKESLWAASDSQKMLHFKTCSLRLHSREQGEPSVISNFSVRFENISVRFRGVRCLFFLTMRCFNDAMFSNS